MRLNELIKGVDILECCADSEIEISSVCYDSRKATPGAVFVAVSGFETDGHKYIKSAFANGAVAVVCERKPEISIPYVIVKDCRNALAIMSCNYFGNPSEKMKVIGITGTNGKTTSSYLIKHMIEHCTGEKVGLIGTNGNMIGDRFIPSERTTPESFELQELFAEMNDSGCSYVVMEVSSHSLKLSRVAGIKFFCSVFTNLTQDHLDFHKTMDDYAESKSLIFKSSINACVNADDLWSEYMLSRTECCEQVYSFSTVNKSAVLFAQDISYTSKGVSFDVRYNNRDYDTFLSIPGTFSVYNALGVFAAGLALGYKPIEICEAMRSADGVKGRLEIVKTNTPYTVIIDYAHTPDALENVLKTLKQLSNGRLICLFGCGGDRDREKRPIMGKTVSELADVCIVTSDNPRTEEPQAIIDDILTGISRKDTVVICDRIEAIHWAVDNAYPDDVILLAGKGHEDYQVIGHEKHHMDEREIVINYLKETGICF